jgi:sarcosine oxidase, subunit gamma
VTAEAGRRSPLAERAGELDRLEAIELAFLAQIDVRCQADDAGRLGFPTAPNTVTGDMARGTLWLGPDEWLVVGLPGTAGTTAAEFEAALDGTHHSVVDVSANRAVIELRSADRLMLLETGCPIDLHPRGGWGPGRCAQTMFAHAQVLLHELELSTRVFVRPSFADYVVRRLLAARDVAG